MMPRFWPMFRKEFIQMRRDRLTFGMLIGIPVIQLLVFGYAIQTDVRNLPTVVLDESRTPESRDLIAAFENTGNFRVVTHVDGRPALDAAIARGDAQAGIVVPYAYPRDLARGTTATVQVIVDAADPLSSQAALSAAAGVAQVLILGRFVFDVPLTGNILLLYGVSLIFIIASLALGLFVSTLVRTQQQAMQASFGFMLPNILLSGFMFPRQAMPEFAQWLGLLVPLTYFLKVVRGILLKGVGLEALWREVLILAGFAVVLIAASVRRFRKTLD